MVVNVAEKAQLHISKAPEAILKFHTDTRAAKKSYLRAFKIL